MIFVVIIITVIVIFFVIIINITIIMKNSHLITIIYARLDPHIRLSTHHLPEGDAQRVDVGARGWTKALEKLRSTVGHSPGHLVPPRALHWGQALLFLHLHPLLLFLPLLFLPPQSFSWRQLVAAAEVSDAQPGVLRDEAVGGFEVEVHDVEGVKVVEAASDLQGQAGNTRQDLVMAGCRSVYYI